MKLLFKVINVFLKVFIKRFLIIYELQFKKNQLFSFIEKTNMNCSYINHLHNIAIQIIYVYNIIKDEKFNKNLIYNI